MLNALDHSYFCQKFFFFPCWELSRDNFLFLMSIFPVQAIEIQNSNHNRSTHIYVRLNYQIWVLYDQQVFTCLLQLLWFTATRINVAIIWKRLVGSWSKEKEDCKGSSDFNSHSHWDGRVSTCIPTEMDEDENERESRKKNVVFAGNMAITEITILTYLHLKFFLSQMWFFKYFIDNVV